MEEKKYSRDAFGRDEKKYSMDATGRDKKILIGNGGGYWGRKGLRGWAGVKKIRL